MMLRIFLFITLIGFSLFSYGTTILGKDLPVSFFIKGGQGNLAIQLFEMYERESLIPYSNLISRSILNKAEKGSPKAQYRVALWLDRLQQDINEGVKFKEEVQKEAWYWYRSSAEKDYVPALWALIELYQGKKYLSNETEFYKAKQREISKETNQETQPEENSPEGIKLVSQNSNEKLNSPPRVKFSLTPDRGRFSNTNIVTEEEGARLDYYSVLQNPESPERTERLQKIKNDMTPQEISATAEFLLREGFLSMGGVSETSENYERSAFDMFMGSAELGSAQAQYLVAEMYRKGIGVEPNAEKAKLWNIRSAKQDYPEAKEKLAHTCMESFEPESA